ncbi:paralemmin 1a [Brachionichthys hirsutus]|uniref:paralemmin 1a n=1 Tax=Brachionichthys hirsutus TaxID=412623 RepID=UPI003604FA62
MRSSSCDITALAPPTPDASDHSGLIRHGEKRKWQAEIENKKRQLEDDRRALQHLKSKALRERWLLDGAPSAGQEQDEAKQDEAKTRSLEDIINSLEEELQRLEAGSVCESVTLPAAPSGSVQDGQVKGHGGNRQQDVAAASGQALAEVKVHKGRPMNKPSEAAEETKRAMYSVEIKVERDRVTGETRVLSTNTTLPVDLSHQGVKVYEDERKVVHEMNGEDGVQLLSYTEVEELIHKADEASVMSQTGDTAEVQEDADHRPLPLHHLEITGLEAKPGGEPSAAEAGTENPVTMVFMGYQDVEDEDETKKVLGLRGTVKAELVLIEGGDGNTSPVQGKEDTSPLSPPVSTAQLVSAKPPEAAAAASNGETAGEAEELRGGEVVMKKEKQPCKCCSVM